MSEQAPIPAGGSAPAPAVVAAPAPVTAPASSTDSIFSAAELAAIESAGAGTLAPAAKKADDYTSPGADPVVAPVATPDSVTPAAPVVAPAAEDEADPLEGIKGIKIKPQNFQDMEVLRLMKPRNGAPGLTLKEAYAKVYPDTAPAVSPVPVAPADKPVAPAADPASDAIRAEITALETQSDKAADDMEHAKANRLNRQIVAKEAELRQIEAERRANAQAAETAKVSEADTIFRQKSTESAKEVYAARPSLADKASADRTEFDAFTNLKFSDPDYKAIFDSPHWPAVLYREFAEAKGWNKATAPVSAPALPAPAPGASAAPRATAATVLTPGETPGGASAQTPAQLLASLDSMSVDQLRSLLPGGRR